MGYNKYAEHIFTEDCPLSIRNIDIYQSTHNYLLTYKTTAIHHCHGNHLCNETAQPSAAYQTSQVYRCVLTSFVHLLNHRQIRLSLTNLSQPPTTDQSQMAMVVKEREMCRNSLMICIFIECVRGFFLISFSQSEIKGPLERPVCQGRAAALLEPTA